MQLNCKPGDLAVIVRATNPVNIGKVVRVVRPIRPGACIGFASNGEVCHLDPDHPWWEIDTPLELITSNWATIHAPYAPDTFLRPLRDSDEPDETLSWEGTPLDNLRTLDEIHRALTGEGLR